MQTDQLICLLSFKTKCKSANKIQQQVQHSSVPNAGVCLEGNVGFFFYYETTSEIHPYDFDFAPLHTFDNQVTQQINRQRTKTRRIIPSESNHQNTPQNLNFPPHVAEFPFFPFKFALFSAKLMHINICTPSIHLVRTSTIP